MKVWELRKIMDGLSDDAEVVIMRWCVECTSACAHDLLVDATDVYPRLDSDGHYLIFEPDSEPDFDPATPAPPARKD